MVNRYDQAAPVQYVSQYVPIPFQELVMLGKHYADERKAAEKELSSYIKNIGDFHSLITKDNESYRDIAFNERDTAYLSPTRKVSTLSPSQLTNASSSIR